MFSVKSKLAEKLNIPEDISNGSSIVTITGNQMIFIENYKGIIEYQTDCIKLHTNDCKITISGKNMQIVYYTNVDMKIEGQIESICYS